MIYLDNNSTTLIDHEVAECFSKTLGQDYVNPASQHQGGRRARQRLEQARDDLIELLGGQVTGIDVDRLILTSGGTEANNMAIIGLSASRPGSIVVSSVEHPSVLETASMLNRTGREVRYLPVDRSGLADLGTLRKWIQSGSVAMVSLQLANNETGILQPFDELVDLCRTSGVAIHTDAVQALGKVDLRFRDLQVDAMTITAHKAHGPIGIGGLMLRHGVQCEPILRGGFQQESLRAGTESVAMAVAFEQTIRKALKLRAAEMERVQALRDDLQSRILKEVPGSCAIGTDVPRLPNTLCLAFPGKDRQSLQMSLDLRGVACSTGSACASGSSQPSHVLREMGLADPIVQSAIRLSLSRLTTHDEIEQAIEVIVAVGNG